MKRKLSGPDWVTSDKKRHFDVALTGVTSLPASVIVGAAAVVSMALEHENPFFAQYRGGENYESFKIYKLRTMPGGTPEARAQYLAPNTVTPYQQIIRNLRLNELPQLVNILLGDMSWVGPRPQIASHTEETMDLLSPPERKLWLRARSICRPGAFDPYIVNSLMHDGEIDDPIARAYSDIQYAMEGTMRMDVEILRAGIHCSRVTRVNEQPLDQSTVGLAA